MPTAIDVAKHLLQLARAEADEPELITNLRLQKLLYYVQGWSLALLGRPLFRGRLEAWPHGPVAPEAYARFERFVREPIPADSLDREPDRLSTEDKALIASVWESYKVHSASRLRQMTHEEAPWLRAWEPAHAAGGVRQEISQAEMRDYFRQRYEETALPGLDLAALERADEDFRLGRDVALEDVLAREP